MTFVLTPAAAGDAQPGARTLVAAPASAGGRTATPATAAADASDTTDRLIVRMRERIVANPDLKIAQLAGRWGENLRHRRVMADGNLVVQLPRRMGRHEAAALARRLAADAEVAYAEPDLLLKPMRVPNDGLYPQQWNYFDAVGGINLPAAWDITTGASSITVAVIDTGVRPHADLASRLVAGYDFISDVTVANDGNGRDADASDPGDYGCNGSTSSWHGTHVAGTVGAATNNGAGVAGVNWTSKIQPVRVLGQCGGYTSDIADGMRWAAGIAVPGAPANATPARVLNMSLGGGGSCGSTLQNAINDVTARGAVVVVAAGNSGIDASNSTPANCSGVISVAATTRTGARASYSNYGTTVSIAAPGGGGGQAILSTLNSGSTTPGDDSYAYYQGTSMATPHVAGVVSLMLSANPALTPAQVLAKLQSSARAFPTGTGFDCSRTTCGAGIVDAAAALGAAPATPPPATSRPNLALASAGAVVTASSTYSASFPPAAVNDGDRRGVNWGSGGGWNDATANAWPDWVQVDFGAARTVAEIDVFTLQDAYGSPQEPTETTTFGSYGITDYEVQYWTGSAWQTVAGGSVTGNNKVWRRFSFAAVSTSRIRVNVVRSLGGYSRVTEIEAYATSDIPPATDPTPTPTPTPDQRRPGGQRRQCQRVEQLFLRGLPGVGGDQRRPPRQQLGRRRRLERRHRGKLARYRAGQLQRRAGAQRESASSRCRTPTAVRRSRPRR